MNINVQLPLETLPDVNKQQALQERLLLLAVRGKVVSVTQSLVLTPTDGIDSLQVDATLGNVTVTLPSPTGDNSRRRVIKTDVSANTVTVDGDSYLINGVATQVLAAQYDKVWVEPTGLGWLII